MTAAKKPDEAAVKLGAAMDRYGIDAKDVPPVTRGLFCRCVSPEPQADSPACARCEKPILLGARQ